MGVNFWQRRSPNLSPINSPTPVSMSTPQTWPRITHRRRNHRWMHQIIWIMTVAYLQHAHGSWKYNLLSKQIWFYYSKWSVSKRFPLSIMRPTFTTVSACFSTSFLHLLKVKVRFFCKKGARLESEMENKTLQIAPNPSLQVQVTSSKAIQYMLPKTIFALIQHYPQLIK